MMSKRPAPVSKQTTVRSRTLYGQKRSIRPSISMQKSFRPRRSIVSTRRGRIGLFREAKDFTASEVRDNNTTTVGVTKYFSERFDPQKKHKASHKRSGSTSARYCSGVRSRHPESIASEGPAAMLLMVQGSSIKPEDMRLAVTSTQARQSWFCTCQAALSGRKDITCLDQTASGGCCMSQRGRYYN